MIEVRIKGDKALLNKLRRMPRKVQQQLGPALFQEGERVMAISKAKFVPVKTGNLRSSGFVKSPKVTFNGVSVTIGYGGAAAPYALPVHEAPASYNWSVSGTGPKYLEKPARQAAQTMASRIARKLKVN